MIELRLLGPPRVRAADGRKVEPLVRQSKRTALLAYLAAAVPRGAHRRDKLLALFWPESDDPHARAALSQALYVLRSALGEEAILSRGDDEVALNLDVISCDALAFEEALDAGRPADALSLYGGELLDGFFVTGAPDFERWLDQERRRLRERASEGSWALAEAKAADGDAVEAERWARRAADLLPADEAVVRRLMTFLHGLGDRAAALRAFEDFARRLTEEYELEPSAETKGLAEAIRHEKPGRLALRWTKLRSPVPTAVVARVHRDPSARRLAAAMVVAVAGLAVVGLTWLRWPTPSPRPLARFALEFAGVPPLASGIGGATIALSPDGSHLVYLGAGEEGPQLYLRPMDRLEAVPIPHTRGARLPVFSPDGDWLAFVMGSTIRKVPLRDGPAITMSTVSTNLPGASWGVNGKIVFATPGGLWQVSADGGEPTMLAASDTSRGERYRWPHVLPNGRAALFTRVDNTGFHLAALSLDAGAVVPLGVEGTSPQFVTPGYLVFARPDGVVLAAPFDPAALRIIGSALPIAAGVLVGIAGDAKFGISRNGDLAYVPESSDRALALVDRGGRARILPLPRRGFASPRFSPDGRRIAAAVTPAGGELPDIWVVDLGRNTSHRLTFDRGNVAPVWRPDGTRIAFATKPGGRPFGFGIRWMAADATDSAETLLPGHLDQLPVAFTPDGRTLVFQRRDPESQGDLWILPLEGERKPRPYLRGPAHEHAAAVSPDGEWLAYASDEPGQEEVYVRAFPHAGAPIQISSGGGREPRWAPSGRELFYRSGEGMVAVAIETASALTVASRQVLFDDSPYLPHIHEAGYDVHPDGQHFVMVLRGSKDREVVVVLNWFEELASRRR